MASLRKNIRLLMQLIVLHRWQVSIVSRFTLYGTLTLRYWFKWVNPLNIKERLGNEDIETTLGTYGHLYPNSNFEVAKKLNNILSFEPAKENLNSSLKNQFTASYIRNEKIKSVIKKKKSQNTLNKGFLALLSLFPLNRSWWLAGNIIDNSVDVVHFVYDAA